MILHTRLDSMFMRLRPFFFVFFFEAWFSIFVVVMAFPWVSYIIHGTHKPLFSPKLLLKMGPIVLFTNLKIILL